MCVDIKEENKQTAVPILIVCVCVCVKRYFEDTEEEEEDVPEKTLRS